MTVATGTATYYEVECTNGERHIFVGYTQRIHNRRMLINLLLKPMKSGRKRLDLVCALTDTVDQSWRHGMHARDGVCSGDWHIRWTDRTERECEQSTQLAETIY